MFYGRIGVGLWNEITDIDVFGAVSKVVIRISKTQSRTAHICLPNGLVNNEFDMVCIAFLTDVRNISRKLVAPPGREFNSYACC